MQTLNARFLAEVRKSDWEPAFICTIAKSDSVYWTCQSRPCASVTYPIGLARVDPIEAKLDPLKRSTSVGTCILQMHDEWIRPIIKNYRIKKCRVTLTLGAANLVEADFVPYAVGAIERMTPIGDRITELEISDIVFAALDKSISGYWWSNHPYQVIYDIALNKCAVPSAQIDTPAFLPESHLDISDFVTVYGAVSETPGEVTAVTNQSAKGLIDDLCRLTNSTLWVNEAGLLSIKRVDIDSAIVATWDRDVHGGRIDVIEQVAHLKNRITMDFTRKGNLSTDGSDDAWINTHRVDDLTSMGEHGYPGEVTVIEEMLIRTEWISAYLGILESTISAQQSYLVINGSALFAGCGARGGRPQVSQPVDARISSARPGYLRIDNEIIKFESMAFSDQEYVTYMPVDSETGVAVQQTSFPTHATLLGLTRGALGTTPAIHFGALGASGGALGLVFDYTIPIRICDEILARLANGVDIINVATGFDQFGVQLGDLVGVVEPSYVSYGIDGLTATTKWEVTGRSPRVHEGCIVWELTSAVNATTSRRYAPNRPAPLASDFADRIRLLIENQGQLKHVRGGLGITAGDGLAAIIAAGSAAGGDSRTNVPAAVTLDLQPGIDTHIGQDLATGGIIVKELPAGSNPPSPGGTSMPLGVVTTGAAAVTTTNTTEINTSPVAPHNFLAEAGAEQIVNGRLSAMSRR